MTKEEIMANYSSSSSDDSTGSSNDNSEQPGQKLPQSLVDNNENIPTSMAKNTKNPALPSLQMNNSSIRPNTPRDTCKTIVNHTTERDLLGNYLSGSSDYGDEDSDNFPRSVKSLTQAMVDNRENIPTPMVSNTEKQVDPSVGRLTRSSRAPL